MANANSQNGIVNLNSVQQNHVVHIDLSQELSESIFKQQYQKAAKNITDIIIKSNEVLDRSWQEESNTSQNLTSFHTAVPFIGDRGTGKTSVMCSIMDRLRHYNGNNPLAAFHLGADCNDAKRMNFDNAKFIVFDMIDAGMLKKTDDVMEIILAQMLGYLEDIRLDRDFRDLYRQIDELHKNLCLIHGEWRGERKEYGLTSLQRVTDSRNAVNSFQKLVEEFRQTMSRHKFNGQRCYLVIALDDIDMYQGSNWGMRNSQFALLEHIYAHLRIPGLIVLMTYNEHLLKRACNRHFEEIYFGRQVNRRYTSTEQHDIDSLTAQFMSKQFPQEKRIYMPNYLLVNALNQPNLYVSPMLNGKQLPPFTPAEKELVVKEFMLRLIAHRTGVYFDVAGTKKHFFEPRNLRELGELLKFINTLDEIPEGKERGEMARLRNRQAFLDYIKNQFALRHLNAEEYDQFANLMMLPLWRQDRTLIDQIRQQRQAVTKTEDDFGYLSGTKEDRWRYSYGELLHNIYFSTRISKTSDSKEPYFRKEFMHCIFGTHSVQLNEALYNAQSRKDAMKIIGSSLAGRWANKMLPKVRLRGYTDPAGAGSISIPIRDFFTWQIPEVVQDEILKMGNPAYLMTKDKLGRFMEAMVVAGMFFTSIPAQGLRLHLDAGENEADHVALYLCSNSEEHICFNVLNFAINLYNALPDEKTPKGEYLPFIQETLCQLGVNLAELLQLDWEEKLNDAEAELNALEKQIGEDNSFIYNLEPANQDLMMRNKKDAQERKNRAEKWVRLKNCVESEFNREQFSCNWNSLLNDVIQKFMEKIRRWRETYGENEWVLPIQNFDMMYNITKRLANVSYHDIPDDANVSDVFKYYVLLYQSIAEELRNQDQFYSEDRSGSFCEALQSCVFYSTITAPERTENGMLNEDYNPYIEEILVSMVASTIPAQAARLRAGNIPL